MTRQKRWVEKEEHGIRHVSISSWKYFSDYLNSTLLEFPGYVFRGHRSEKWLLESTLDRLIKSLPKDRQKGVKGRHLQNFKYAVRGRRGLHPPILATEDDWWALGQHHGLASPLLDWTESPFVAAYFAYHESRQTEDGRACIWAVHWPSIEATIGKDLPPEQQAVVVRPLSDENSRLVNQVGLFIRIPELIDLESWIIKHNNPDLKGVVLLKITLPSKDRESALKLLNRMNINHSTLFPDLTGSSVHCNNKIKIRAY